MANEILIGASLSFAKSGDSDVMAGNATVTLNGSKHLHQRMTVTTTELALQLGAVTAGGYLFIRNADPTNYVQVKAATGATPLVRLKAGEFCLFRLDAGATAPFIQANTASCDVEYLLLAD